MKLNLSLRFTADAMQRLVVARDLYAREVGCMGLCDPEDPLLVTDLQFVKQFGSGGSVEFDDESLHRHVAEMARQGVSPEQYFRVWIHTHPGSSPHPSSRDEDTFRKVYGHAPWGVMAILSQTGATYCRFQGEVRLASGRTLGRTTQEIPLAVDYMVSTNAVDVPSFIDTIKPNLCEEPAWGKGQGAVACGGFKDEPWAKGGGRSRTFQGSMDFSDSYENYWQEKEKARAATQVGTPSATILPPDTRIPSQITFSDSRLQYNTIYREVRVYEKTDKDTLELVYIVPLKDAMLVMSQDRFRANDPHVFTRLTKGLANRGLLEGAALRRDRLLNNAPSGILLADAPSKGGQ